MSQLGCSAAGSRRRGGAEKIARGRRPRAIFGAPERAERPNRFESRRCNRPSRKATTPKQEYVCDETAGLQQAGRRRRGGAEKIARGRRPWAIFGAPERTELGRCKKLSRKPNDSQTNNVCVMSELGCGCSAARG